MSRRLLLWCWAVAAFSCAHPRPAATQPTPNWQNQDLDKDGVFGISTEKAYAQLLQGRRAKNLIVAIFDGGIDTTQADLRPVLWTDPVSGVHGYNYLGEESGKEDFIPIITSTSPDGRTLADYRKHVANLRTFLQKLTASEKTLEQIEKNIRLRAPLLADFQRYQPKTDDERRLLPLIIAGLPNYPDYPSFKFHELDQPIRLAHYHLDYSLSPQPSAAPPLFTADTTDISNGALGLVEDPNVNPYHGTMMAGIVAAVRNNGKGINGIADHAQIMMLKLFSNIREARDYQVARAIVYAVDHGARVISMSFGRGYTLHKTTVDSAVRYAMSRDVLIVHAAGNDGLNLDVDSNTWYPSPKYIDGGGAAGAWLTVGASGFRDDSTLAASFSNYGVKTVDVFAPGVQITSTTPYGASASWDGTSEAAPIVAGLAALIMEYYPSLSALQVKEVIIKSVIKRAALRDKCVSGGVVNAYEALKMASATP